MTKIKTIVVFYRRDKVRPGVPRRHKKYSSFETVPSVILKI